MKFEKKALFVPFVILIFSTSLCGQVRRLNIGGGYFGETISHPGFVAEIEREKLFTDQIGVSTRLDAGFYHHPRSHDALFVDISRGFRRYFNNGFFLEQYIGLGVMTSFYNEDVWHIDNNGNAVRVSRFGNFDFMPSVIPGIGFLTGRPSENRKMLWLRPKIFWQLPFNNLALPHIAFQAGITFKLKMEKGKLKKKNDGAE